MGRVAGAIVQPFYGYNCRPFMIHVGVFPLVPAAWLSADARLQQGAVKL